MAITLKEENEIGYVIFNNPDLKVNVLSSEVLRRLEMIVDELKGKTSLKAVVFLSEKKDVFIAGADIKEIEQMSDPAEGASKAKAGQDIFNKIEDLPVPTIAVIDGVALGGGCELALSCRYRLATFNEKVMVGLPEVNLGILPGFGGTYRLPRIIGLQQALGIILAGKSVDGRKALKIGLVDRLVPVAGLDGSIREFVQDALNKKIKGRKAAKGFNGFLDNSRLGHDIVLSQAKKNILKATKGFYPAPLKAVAVIKQNLYTDRTKGLEIERKGFGELVITHVCKSLIKVFYLNEKFKKLTLDGSEGVKPRVIEQTAVLGAGVMGGGIAQLFSYKGIWTRMKDINHDAIAKGFQAAGKIYAQLVKRRRLSKAQANERMAKISGTVDYSGFKKLDLVVEAVVENMDIKKKVFKELSSVVPPQTILATNTSALSVTEMAKETSNPANVIGLHFFNPVHRMPLIEIITTEYTSKETIVSMLALVRKLGKTPILVKDSCGFVVNRILLCYIAEAGRILEETGQMEAIDKVMTDFGMPMGPFTLSDEVGLDVGVKVMHILEDAFGERFKSCAVFEKILEKKLLGKKIGKGFYIHGKKRLPNPEIATLLPQSGLKPLTAEECVHRLIYTMINEAASCLEDGIVDGADAIDVGMIFGTGFPPFRGGLLRYADDVGVDKIISVLTELGQKYNTNRFMPSAFLTGLQQKKNNFYNS